MGLQVYHKKRDFAVTPEPRGRTQRDKGGRYVIQKHAARRLHYDLRLELDGVMKSWAVTRGPSLVPGEKRLAIHVEDHPIEYNTFEGTIPQGQYGGGTVMIWDRGHWYPEGDPHKDYRNGRLAFVLDGEKLKGRWHLVRMRKRPNERQDPWLLIKCDDEAARSASDATYSRSNRCRRRAAAPSEEIAEGRGGKRVWQSNRGESPRKAAKTSAKKIARAGSPKGHGRQRHTRSQAATPRPSAKNSTFTKKSTSTKNGKATGKKAAKAKSGGDPLPDFVPPALATLRAAAPSGAGWLHEVKFDGYRIQARLDHGEVRLLTRKGLDWARQVPQRRRRGRGTAGRDGAARRRAGGRGRERNFKLLGLADRSQGRTARSVRLLCVRSSPSRRHRSHASAADGAQGRARTVVGPDQTNPGRSG